MRIAGLLVVASLALGGVPIRGASAPQIFQPVLLAFDPTQDRLYVTVSIEEGSRSKLVLISNPERDGGTKLSSFDLPGVASGLSYDSDSGTLFAGNSSGHELLIFDHIDPSSMGSPTRILKRFAFPTGVYADASGNRLFVLDAHPGSLRMFGRSNSVQGEQQPDLLLSGHESGLNGPFAITADPAHGHLYVSNFDGVLIFNLRNLSAPPDRLPLPPGTLARGLSFDAKNARLYIAAPMAKSFFIYDGTKARRVKVRGAEGTFPFSVAVDSEHGRLYLAGTEPQVGVIALRGPDLDPGTAELSVDRWIRLDGEAPSPFEHPAPQAPPDGVS